MSIIKHNFNKIILNAINQLNLMLEFVRKSTLIYISHLYFISRYIKHYMLGI